MYYCSHICFYCLLFLMELLLCCFPSPLLKKGRMKKGLESPNPRSLRSEFALMQWLGLTLCGENSKAAVMTSAGDSVSSVSDGGMQGTGGGDYDSFSPFSLLSLLHSPLLSPFFLFPLLAYALYR